MAAYYNEHDRYAAQWLRNLIAAGHIAPGDVDERDIRDVRPDELAGYTQCHFFAGIGVWSHALRRAGWPDDRLVWTGSCPCQPFSAAGRRAGVNDERHLWPHWYHLIQQCGPDTIFGEQVASKDGLGWLDLVQADLEGAGYATGAVDLCAAGVGAPHLRQRLWFVATHDKRPTNDSATGRPGGVAIKLGNPTGTGLLPGPHPGIHRGEESPRPRYGQSERPGADGQLADTTAERRQRGRTGEAGDEPGAVQRSERFCDAGSVANTHGGECDGLTGGQGRECNRTPTGWQQGYGEFECGGSVSDVGHTNNQGSQGRGVLPERAGELAAGQAGVGGFWVDAEWLPCTDGKARPVEPGTFPLAHGAPARVGRLRAYGNAINTEAAIAVISSAMPALEGPPVSS